MVYSILLIIIIIISIKNEKVLNFSNFFLSSLLYLICFGIFPLIFLNVDIPNNYLKGWLRFINIDVNFDHFIINFSCFLALIGYILFVFGYKLFCFKPKELIVYKSTQKRLIFYFSAILLFIGTISFFIYLSSLGSIVSGLLTNNRMLYENDRVDVESSVSFLFVFSKIIISSAYIQWGNLKINKSLIVKVFFWFSLIIAFLYLFRNSGRLSVITFLFTFGLAEAIYSGKLPKFKLFILVFIAGFLTLFGKSLFSIFLYEDSLDRAYSRYAGNNESLFALLDFLGEFSFPFLSLTSNLKTNIDFLWFKDLIFWFTYAFPAGIFPPIVNTSYYNTINVLGPSINKSGVPSDILSYGYLNLGYFGLLIVPLLFGIVCRWFDSFKKYSDNPLSSIMTIALTFIIGFRVMYFDPKHLFKGSFYYYFVLLSILLVIYVSKKFKFK